MDILSQIKTYYCINFLKYIPYCFAKNVSKKNKQLVNKYLNIPEGWRKKGYKFKETKKNPIVIVYFENSKKINEYFQTDEDDEELSNLSVTDRGVFPITIHFNKTNWNKPPKEFKVKPRLKKKRLEMYRKYLVLHEFGHVLGYDHPPLPTKYGKCDVMLQQSRFTEPYCEANYEIF